MFAALNSCCCVRGDADDPRGEIVPWPPIEKSTSREFLADASLPAQKSYADGFWRSLSWWHPVILPMLLALLVRTLSGMEPVMCVMVPLLLGMWAVSAVRSRPSIKHHQDEMPHAQARMVEDFQIPSRAGIVSADVWNSGSSRGSIYMLPIECAPLTREQKKLYIDIHEAVVGITFSKLRRDLQRSVWLKPPDLRSRRSAEVVDFHPRDIVRVAMSVLACNAPNAVETASQWLQQIYALRFDHTMDLPRMKLEITHEELIKIRAVYPKGVYGLAKPHGYPIMWDMVSALRLNRMKDAFGTVEAALDRILWYDLHLMELFDRHKVRLSSERDGALMLKGVSIIDLGDWASDLLYPAILRTVLRIIARSGSIWPESIWRVYIVNVPWVFMGSWAAIKKACHPVTLAKLRIFSNRREFFKHLEEDLGVSIDHVPKEHGGRGPSLLDLPMTPTAHLDEL